MAYDDFDDDIPIERQRLMTMKDICKETSLSPSTIYRMIKAGQFPSSVRISKHRVAWRYADFLEWYMDQEPEHDDFII